MTVPELLGILLAIVGLAFAFETPRKWFLRSLRLERGEPRDFADTAQQNSPLAQTRLQAAGQQEASITPGTSYLSVKKVVDSINEAPPFQQQAVAAHYVDIAVEWEGFLRKVTQDPRDNAIVQVNLITDKSSLVSYSIWFSVHVDNVPEIKTLKRDSKLCVAGRIQSASGPGLCVTIEPSSVRVLERAA